MFTPLVGVARLKFITVHDLRTRMAEVWRDLEREGELVLTNNGKPIGILMATDEESLGQSLQEIRRARAARAVARLQQDSVAPGRDTLTDDQSDREIAAAREARGGDANGGPRHDP